MILAINSPSGELAIHNISFILCYNAYVKTLFKLLFISFCFFLTFSQNAQCQDVVGIFLSKDIAHQVELRQKFRDTKADIVTLNRQACAISVLNDKQGSFISASLDKLCKDNSSLHNLLISDYIVSYNSISHNISSYLKNDICIRAP